MPGTPRAAIAFCAASPRVPWTVETLTPTFSNTRPPRITLISPPPASEPSSEARLVSVTSNRPGGPRREGAGRLAVLQRLEGGDDLVAQLAEPGAGARFLVWSWRLGHRRPPFGLGHWLAGLARGGKGGFAARAPARVRLGAEGGTPMRPMDLALLALPLVAGGLRDHPAQPMRGAVPRRAAHRGGGSAGHGRGASAGATGWCRRGLSSACTHCVARPGSCALARRRTVSRCTTSGRSTARPRPRNSPPSRPSRTRLEAAIAACRAQYPEMRQPARCSVGAGGASAPGADGIDEARPPSTVSTWPVMKPGPVGGEEPHRFGQFARRPRSGRAGCRRRSCRACSGSSRRVSRRRSRSSPSRS